MGSRTSTRAHFETLQTYYASFESRIGYRLFLGGTRHFGYYENENGWPWPIHKALRAMEDFLFNALDLPADSLVLDAGCGYGHVACRGAERGLRIEGIDIVDRHVSRAQQTVHFRGFSDQINVRSGDYHDLSAFSNSTFDGLYTMETLVHAADPEQVLSEFFRVLKSGGHLAMNEYEHVPREEVSTDETQIMDLIDKYSAMPAHTKFVLGTIKAMAESAGFEGVQVVDISLHTSPLTWLFYVVALVPYIVLCALGLQHHFINAVAAVGTYRLGKKRIYRYVTVTARKPGTLQGKETSQIKSTDQRELRRRT